MPTYDFYCDGCDRAFERHLPLSSYDTCKDGIPCPLGCGMVAQKVASAPVFQLKGAGFHVNDYRTRRHG